DTYLLSGVSGHGVQSFYYPPKAQKNCAGCHMPLAESDDFGARDFDDDAHRKFTEGVMRVDLFGVKEGGSIEGELTAPLRPQVPALTPGKSYLLEAVVRTVKVGHPFTQGTVDSNEVWLDVRVSSGGR